MRSLARIALWYALAFTIVAATSSAQDIQGTSSFKAEDFVGSIDDFKILAEEALAAKWILTKAAKVEGLTLKKDAGTITLDGFVFLKEPVRGLTTEAQFFGKGRFKLRPPIAMERQQVKRFLGSEAIDLPIESARLSFASLEDQSLFAGFEYSEANVTAAKENEKAAKWLETTGKAYERGRTGDEEDRAKYQAFWNALAQYLRMLYPKQPMPFSAVMEREVPKEQQGLVHLKSVNFDVDPTNMEEVSVVGVWDHGKDKLGSIITRFDFSDQYDGKLDYAATSAAIEAEDKAELGVDSNVMVATVDPGTAAREMVLRTTMELRVLRDGLKHVLLFVTPTMHATRAYLDGKEVGFVQPQIPGEVPPVWAPAIGLLLPRPYAKGEKLTVAVEAEGKVLRNYDGFTWIVLDHSSWYPNPTAAIGAHYNTHFDTTFRVPKGFTAVAPGADTPCRAEDMTPDTDCLRYVTAKPIDRYAFNIGKGLRADRADALDGTPVTVWTNAVSKAQFRFWSPGSTEPVVREYSLTKSGPAVVNKARAALATYEKWFGDYPYDRLVLSPHPKGYGQMFPGFIFLAQDAFLSDSAQAERAAIIGYYPDPWWVDAFVTHETAHMWWGGKAGIRGDRDQWFSEGFADYGSVLCLEAFDQIDGTETMKKELQNWHERITKDDGYVNDVAPLALGNRIDSAENRRGYENVRSWYIYNKGGFVMHMLRTLGRAMKQPDVAAGDELFRKSMRDFLDEHAGTAPSNLDLLKSLSKTYGTNLSWFFDQWVYGTGVPKLEFSHEIATASGKPVLRGRIRQKDTDFKFPISVVLHWGKGKNERIVHYYQWVTQKDQTFEQELDERPDRVTINDDYGVLCTVKEVPWSESAAGQ